MPTIEGTMTFEEVRISGQENDYLIEGKYSGEWSTTLLAPHVMIAGITVSEVEDEGTIRLSAPDGDFIHTEAEGDTVTLTLPE